MPPMNVITSVQPDTKSDYLSINTAEGWGCGAYLKLWKFVPAVGQTVRTEPDEPFCLPLRIYVDEQLAVDRTLADIAESDALARSWAQRKRDEFVRDGWPDPGALLLG